jgi:hypothetical protein
LIVMSDEMSESTLVKVIVPVNPVRSIASELLLLPAIHSPGAAPEDVLLLAAVIASRKVHKPSVPFATSEVLLTVMVLPAAGVITALPGAGGLSAKPFDVGAGFFADVDCHRGDRATNKTKATQMEA